ncbi:WD40 repeat domain-containing protein, partial [Allocoleopsis sp.]|uniref:WD40 repeat domain-containing protein n=1 Tax=Allocoleopsis sp. TaxID=3088169 RepID=UPI002FD1D547
MADNSNQPREYDVVKGSQAPPPLGGVILGGLEGVRSRLMSGVEEQRIAALSEALKYGEAGLDLVIGALQNESLQVEQAAYRILRKRAELRVKQTLREYNPWRLFEMLPYFNENHSSIAGCVAISPDGHIIVSTENRTIKLWNLHTGELIRTLQGHSRSINCIAISPDGHIIVSASQDKIIKFWNLHTGELSKTLVGHSGGIVRCLAISPDGRTLVSGSSDRTIKLWNLHTGKWLRTLERH